MTSNGMGPEWVKEQQRRVVLMDELYKLDGRDGDHPKAGTYTGLYQEYLNYLKWAKYYYPVDEIRQSPTRVR